LEDLELRVCKCRLRAIASSSLESLSLIGCSWAGKEFSEISSPTLKNLVVDRGSNDDIDSPFVVTALALASLFLVVTPYNFPGGVSFGEMPSLARASVHLKERETLAKRAHLRSHLFKILRSVSNVASLELNGFDVTVCVLVHCLSSSYAAAASLSLYGFMCCVVLCHPTYIPQVKAGEESTTFPEFSNLRTLELDQCGLGHDIHVSGHILRNSPNLEKLTLTYIEVMLEGIVCLSFKIPFIISHFLHLPACLEQCKKKKEKIPYMTSDKNVVPDTTLENFASLI
jgi:hypothetical protein